MKRFIVLFILSVSLLGVGQAYAFSPFTLGVKGGLNFSSMSGGYKTRMNYQVGATLDYQIMGNFYLLTGVIYQARGGKKKNIDFVLDDELGAEPTRGSMTVSPRYIYIPLHIATKINIVPDTRLVLRTGPYFSFGVGGKSKISYHQNNVKHSKETDYFGKHRASKTNMGWGLGIGLEMGKIAFDLGYDYGFTKQKQWITGKEEKERNLELSVGYKFKL